MKTHVMRAAWECWLAVREERLDQLATEKAKAAGLSRCASFAAPASAAECVQRQNSKPWESSSFTADRISGPWLQQDMPLLCS